MTLETAQLLSTALTYRTDWRDGMDDYERSYLYRSTHNHHPSSKWCRKTSSNFKWLVDHGLALADEYTYRFGRIHKSRRVIEACATALNYADMSEPLTPFAMAMPDKYKTDDPVLSYRLYYLEEKATFKNNWTLRRKDLPNWLFSRAVTGKS